MGQALDRDGNVLGEAFGDTKREVFDKLSNEFKDAAEIRVRSIGPIERMTNEGRIGTGPDRNAIVERDAMPPDPMEQFFVFAHLPPHLQAVSQPFGELAATIVRTLPRNPERTVALRKLLEAKDCAVRALLFK